MRVTRLTLKEFRSHKDSSLDFDWVNFVLGPNASGKSSIQLALEYALCGKCSVTDAAGRGRELLTRHGAEGFQVELTVGGDRFGRAVNKRGASLTVNGNLVPRLPIETPVEVLSAVLNASHFLQLPAKEQKALLASVLQPAAIELPNEIVVDLKTVAGRAPTKFNLESVAEVEAMYTAVYDERTHIGRQIKELGAPFDSAQGEGSEQATLPSEAGVKAQLDALRRDKEKLVAQRAKGAGAWEAAQEKARQNRAELAELYHQVITDTAEEQRLIALANARPVATKLAGELAAKQAKLATEEANREAVKNLEGKCPTCQMNVTERDRALVVEELGARVSDLRVAVEGIQQELAEYAGWEEAEKRVAVHRVAVVRQEKLLREQAELAKVPAGEGNELDAEIAALEVRIQNGEGVLTRVQEAHRERARVQEVADRRATLEQKLAACERLVEYFGPNGVKTQMVEGTISGFVQKLNAALEHFGYVVNLTLEPYRLELDSEDPLRPPRTVQQLSESEAFRFGVAFQIALALATGVNLVVVDRADVLDKTNRPFLAGLLCQAAREHGVQSIVLSTSSEAPPADPPEGVRFFTVSNEDGISRVHLVDVEVAA